MNHSQTISEQLDKLPDFLAPLKEAANRYLKYPSVVDDAGVLNIGHRPWVAELNYMFRFYPGIDAESLERYCERFMLQVPAMYIDFLRAVNGGFFFGMKLCGVPLSRLGNPSLLNRRILQCHDLAIAATQWVLDYSMPPGYFHFGGRHFSYSANVAYFFDGESRIVSVRGKKKVIGEWTNLTDFMAEELLVSEKLEEELKPAKWNT